MNTSHQQSTAPDVDSWRRDGLPRHVAIIMDGNNRWARRRGLPGRAGHEAGEQAMRAIVEHAGRCGIEALTVFAFSSENWRRPPEEVSALMQLFIGALSKRVPELHAHGIRLRFIGALSVFSPEIRAGIAAAERLTAGNAALHLSVAVNYGGQWDIAQAARALAGEVEAGRLRAEDIDEAHLAQRLMLADLPPPDLLIRTGGEIRVSNFMLWQFAYSEFHFSDLLWPDFDAQAFDAALADYASRQRRFGGSGAEPGSAASGQD
ncbi:MAG: polyprenyl diphosphate synthase [Pseudomonadota bacterium]